MEGLDSVSSMLESMIGEIEEYWEEENGVQVSSIFAHEKHDILTLNKVLLSTDMTNLSVKQLPDSLRNFSSIRLSCTNNQIRAVLSSRNSRIIRTSVLLTPDDLGTPKDRRDDLKPRARQNVIFELGFFIGRLGRSKVCALVKGNVETPSDYDGVVYTELDDAGGWKTKLTQELKAAGLNIDANRAFESA